MPTTYPHRWFGFAAALMTWFAWTPARAALPTDSASSSHDALVNAVQQMDEASLPAPIIFDGDTIAILRSPLAGLSATGRARAALKRIESLRPPGIHDPVRVEHVSGARLIAVGDRPMFGFTEADVDARHGPTVDQTAEAARLRLSRVLGARGRMWAPASRQRAVIYVVVLTAILALLVVLVTRGNAWLLNWMKQDAPWKKWRLRVGGIDFQGRALAVLAWVTRVLGVLIVLVLIAIWVMAILNSFPETRPWGHGLRGFVIATLLTLGTGVLQSIPGVFTAGLIFVLGYLATRLSGEIFEAVEVGRLRLPAIHPETAGATRRLVSVLLWLFTVIVAYPFLPGAQTDTFKGVSVFAGLLLTLGSAGVVGHMMSGLVLVYSRALRPGDYVRVGEVEGIVKEVGTLATKIANVKDEEFTIPNAVMVATTIKNFTRLARQSGAPVTTTVAIGYDAPWRVVHELLIAAAAKTAGIRKQPAPFVVQASLSSFAVEYQLVARLERPETRLQVMNELHQFIQDAFNERGVQIMTPAFEGQPDRPVLVPKSKWSGTPDGAGTE